MNNYIENNPSADVLMNSMRAMGYSFEAAIADVIDNSVAVKFSSNSNRAISLVTTTLNPTQKQLENLFSRR